MLQPKTIGALAFLVIAGLGAWWELSREDAKKETEAPPSPLPAIAATDVDEMIVADAKAGTSVSLLRDGDGWQLTEPLSDEADADNVDRALDQLAKARVSPRAVGSSKQAWDKLKVGPEEALSITLRKGGADLVALQLSADGKFARIGDDESVYEIHGVNRAMFARDVPMWRNRQVVKFDKAKVKSVSVAAADGSRVAADRTPAPPPEKGKPPERDTWTLTIGQQIVGQLDQDAPLGIVSRMQNFTAQDFADDKTKATTGLEPPQLEVTVTLDDGTEQTLQVGADANDDDRYVSRADSGRVWLAAKTTLDSFARAPVQWRDKTIAKLKPDEVTKIDVTHDGFHLVAEKNDNAWTVLQPKGLVADKAKLDAIASAMQNLRGTTVATDVPRAAFKEIDAVAKFTTKDRRQIEVTFGAQQDKASYAKSNTRKDVVLVADYLVNRFRVTEDGLESKPPAAPPVPH